MEMMILIVSAIVCAVSAISMGAMLAIYKHMKKK